MNGSRIAGITSNTVPWEILRAAGYAPCLLKEDAGPTPYADRWMEDVFDHRIRVIFDRLCSGAWSHVHRVVIPRTSEQEHKLYLYLREMARTQAGPAIPELYFYNLLHTRTPESHDYGLERTRQIEQPRASRVKPICEEMTVHGHLLFGVMRVRTDYSSRDGCDNGPVMRGRRSRIDDREKVAGFVLGVTRPEKEVFTARRGRSPTGAAGDQESRNQRSTHALSFVWRESGGTK